jgi:DNA polymerase III alpha subunit
MVELFADLPEALENSVEIAKRCNISDHAGQELPARFPDAAGHDARRFSGARGGEPGWRFACSSFTRPGGAS